MSPAALLPHLPLRSVNRLTADHFPVKSAPEHPGKSRHPEMRAWFLIGEAQMKAVDVYLRLPYSLRCASASTRGYYLRWWRYNGGTERAFRDPQP